MPKSWPPSPSWVTTNFTRTTRNTISGWQFGTMQMRRPEVIPHRAREMQCLQKATSVSLATPLYTKHLKKPKPMP
jgi:hypothetical protein